MNDTTPVGKEHREAILDVLENWLTILSGRRYSPRIKLLRIEEVIAATGMDKRTIYKQIELGLFPKPYKIGRRGLWRETTLIAWRLSPARTDAPRL
jgi:predicted DNA-binding transcriptional regulator AlpA